jgi:aspartate/methionine/tyrosine aminotransferase
VSRLVELVQIVEDDDIVAIADESFREVTADESRTPP